MPVEKTGSKISDTRRSTKPIMEKRRRARINNSLTELKNLILDALKKDNARHSKLEKADILEMTVKHLQVLQRHHASASVVSDPSAIGKFRSGFNECANEVSRYLSRIDGVDPSVRQRLLNHLSSCLSTLNTPTPPSTPTATTAQSYSPLGLQSTLQPVHVQVPTVHVTEPSHEAVDVSKAFHGLQLVPTRLASGEIAFFLPTHNLGQHANLLSVYTAPVAGSSSPSSSSLASSPSPVSVLGSAGILSPAVSDRSISPASMTSTFPTYEPVSPALPVDAKPDSSPVWRPW